MDFDQPPVVRVEADPEQRLAPDHWPADIPAVAQVLRDGLTLAKGVTFLVGENGSGKSTLVEGVAMAYGLGSEGGSIGSRHVTRGSESPLSRSLRLRRGLGAGRWGFFLRAETMHGFYTYLEENPGSPADEHRSYDLAEIVHWLEVFARRYFQFSQFKRSAMPNGPKVSAGGSLSPRGDWRAPSDLSARIWLDEIATLPTP